MFCRQSNKFQEMIGVVYEKKITNFAEISIIVKWYWRSMLTKKEIYSGAEMASLP